MLNKAVYKMILEHCCSFQLPSKYENIHTFSTACIVMGHDPLELKINASVKNIESDQLAHFLF